MYVFFMGFPTSPSASHIHLHKLVYPFLCNCYKNCCVVFVGSGNTSYTSKNLSLFILNKNINNFKNNFCLMVSCSAQQMHCSFHYLIFDILSKYFV